MRQLPYEDKFPAKSEKRTELWEEWNRTAKETKLTWREFLDAEVTKPNIKVGDLVRIKLTKHQVRIAQMWYLPHNPEMQMVRGYPKSGWHLGGILERDADCLFSDRTNSRDGEIVKDIPISSVDCVLIENK